MADKLEDIYLAVFDALKTLAVDLQYGSEAAFKQVIQGWKTSVGTLPACFILPSPDMIRPASTKKDYHVFRFIIAVVTEKADVETGLKDSIKLACALYDKLVEDRTLGHKADNLEVTTGEFHWRRTPAFIRHWTALFVEVHKFYV